MKTRGILFMIPVMLICISDVFTQSFIICGDSSTDTYVDIAPDLVYDEFSQPLPWLDVTGDNQPDFEFYAYSYKYGYTIFFLILNEQIESLHYHNDSLPWMNDAFGFAYGDTIKAQMPDMQWEHTDRAYLSESGGGYWYSDTAKYFVFRYLDGVDTSMGWLYMDTREGIKSVTIYNCSVPKNGSLNFIYPEPEIYITPIPTNHAIYIAYNKTGIIQVTDMSGRILWHDDFNYEQTLDLSMYPDGTYVLTIYTGREMISKQFILY